MNGLEERDEAAETVAVKPRVTLEQIKSLIDREEYHVFDDTLTVCVLTLKNGYKVLGQSACADPANFNEELGAKIAKEKAVAEIWPLAGFLLRDQLHRQEHIPVVRAKFIVTGHYPVAQPAAGAKWDDEKGGYDKVVPDGEMVQMSAVYKSGAVDGGNACEENRIFSEATPFAFVQMHIRNLHAVKLLPTGKSFYIDFTPAD
jgi:hypothetical protein